MCKPTQSQQPTENTKQCQIPTVTLGYSTSLVKIYSALVGGYTAQPDWLFFETAHDILKEYTVLAKNTKHAAATLL